MSLRNIIVQYLGTCLRLPELERDVTLITTEDGKRYVEVVRCGDCEFFEQDDIADGCTQFDFSIEYMEQGYCAWASRKVDA